MKTKNQSSKAINIRGGRSIRLLIKLAAVAGLMLLLDPSPVRGQNRLCFPSTTWFTPPSPAPVIDGVVTGDPGWQPAFRTDLGSVIVQGIRDTNYLYLSVQASGVDSISSNTGTSNLVLLTFDSGGAGAGPFQQIQILPVIANATAGYSGPSGTITYWDGSLSGTNVNWGTRVSPTPNWLLTGNVQVNYPDINSWALEMKLPFSPNKSSGLVLPSPQFFDVYVDVFRVVSGKLHQSSWPPNQVETSPCAQDVAAPCYPGSNTPNVGNWGSSTLGSTCRWVTIQNISVTNATNTNGLKIDLFSPNTFNIQVNNNVPAGTLPNTAKQVSAEFVIANFGLPSSLQWQPVPTTNNPKGPVDLPPGPTTLSPDAWTVPNNSQPPPNQRSYDPAFEFDPVNPSHPHQCIQVKLTTPDTSTAVTNSPSQQNMDFQDASRVVRRAEVNGQYPPRLNSDGNPAPDQVFDLRISTRQEILTKGRVKNTDTKGVTHGSPTLSEKGDGGVVSRLIWVAEGCRHTGRYMTISEHKLELCDPVGTFGYVVRHRGITPVGRWNLAFTGPGLERVPGTNNLYRVHVPNDGVAKLDTKFEPSEERFAFFLDAGAGIPQGTFSNVFNTGFSLNAGLEYMIASHFSAEGIFGYHHFPAKIGSSLDVYQFSANAKLYLTPPPTKVRPFVNFGPGGYKFSPGSTNFGGNFGGGVLFQLTSRFGLQGSYNFHVVNTAGSATKWSTAQGGFRLVF